MAAEDPASIRERCARVGGLLFVFLATVLPAPVQASGYGFIPVRIDLGARVPSATLTLKSQDSQPFRFQLNVFAWTQTKEGGQILTPTKDIVFFPQLFTLEPGKERIVRIGAATPVTATEKTYRLVVTQLPPLEGPEIQGSPRVGVLTNVSIPIFLQPPRLEMKGQVDAVSVGTGYVRFEVKNLGNVHFQVKEAIVKGLASTGASIHEDTLPGWYVLAGGTQVFVSELRPPRKCAQIKTVTIEAKYERGSLKAQAAVSPVCE